MRWQESGRRKTKGQMGARERQESDGGERKEEFFELSFGSTRWYGLRQNGALMVNTSASQFCALGCVVQLPLKPQKLIY